MDRGPQLLFLITLNDGVGNMVGVAIALILFNFIAICFIASYNNDDVFQQSFDREMKQTSKGFFTT